MQTPSPITRLIAATAVVSAAMWTLATPPTGPVDARMVVVLIVAAVLVEWFPLTIDHRGETLHATLSGVVIALGVVFVGPVPTVVARLTGTAVGMALRWRMSPQKLAFNLAIHSVEVWLVAVVLAPVAAGGLDGPSDWAAVPLALLVSDAVTFGLVLGVLRLASGPLRGEAVLRMAVGSAYTVAISATFALAGAVMLEADPRAALSLLAIFALLVHTNRARHGIAERHRNLSSLYGFMDAVTSTETAEVIQHLLRESQEITGAERAVVMVADTRRSVRCTIEDGRLVQAPVPISALRALTAVADAGALVADGEDRPVRQLTGPPGQQAMIASLGTDDLPGVLLLEGRRGNMPDFDHTDLQLARGMARHAGRALITARLVEQLQRSTDTMERLALYDRQTGMLNRTGLLRTALDMDGRGIALVEILELETFEGTFGHHSSAQIVDAIAARLAGAADLGIVVVGRVAEDRFAVVLDDADDPVGSHHRLRRIQSALREPIRETGINVEVQVRIGVATATTAGRELPQLLRAAAGALNRAKQQHGDEVVWFDHSMDTAATARIRLASDLRDAIDGGELSLVYQPKIALASGAMVGVEALCRWIRPDGRSVDPATFIAIAEQTGLIRPLTEWVVQRAVAQAGAWREQGLALQVAINLSPDVLRDQAVVTQLLEACAVADVPPSSIVAEITESLMIRDVERGAHVLRSLDEAGVRISVDDFGTGYSSLAQLRDLPVHEIKIDRSFVQGLESSPQGQAITGAIIAMAQKLDLVCVAEGVETPAALALVRDAGCHIAQGYLLGRPLTPRDVAARAAGTPQGDRIVPFRRQQPGA